jgi:L-threonylcarbamoyladenylate synthase
MNMSKDHQEAVKILKTGGIAIFPTDTAFGIGCRIDDEKAVERLFRLRKRPETKATPVLVSGIEMAKEYVQEIPDVVVEEFIKPYWPGALTIVLKCKTEKVPGLVRGGGDTLGVRMPDNEILLEIIKEVGVPILGTSANFAGEQTPYVFEDLNTELMSMVDFVVKGECKTKQASTVIDCSEKPFKIIRQGAVNLVLSS